MRGISGLWSKVYRRENVLAFMLILGAILSLIGIPQRIGITTEQITISLLAVLAIDTVIERIGYLDKIEAKIVDLSNKVLTPINIDDFFKSRKQIPAFSDVLQSNNEIWLAARDLDGLVKNYGRYIENAVQSGRKFRIILSNPYNASLMAAIYLGKEYYTSREPIDKRIQGVLDFWVRLSSKALEGKVEVRLADYAFNNTFLIMNPSEINSEMILEYYGYKISNADRLHIHLLKVRDRQIYSYYYDEFIRIWEDAKTNIVNIQNRSDGHIEL